MKNTNQKGTNNMKKIKIAMLTTLFCFTASLVIAGISVTVAWTMPTTNEDGTLLTDLAGARAYMGTNSSIYVEMVDVGMSTNATFTNLNENTIYYFAVTAYDLVGNESDFSLEINYETPGIAPSSPGDITIIGSTP